MLTKAIRKFQKKCMQTKNAADDDAVILTHPPSESFLHYLSASFLQSQTMPDKQRRGHRGIHNSILTDADC